MSTRNKTYVLLALATIFWGIQALCIKLLVLHWTPSALTALRYLCISIILFMIMYLQGERHFLPPKQTLLPLSLMGLMGVAINNVAQFTGLQFSTVTNATLIAATGPAVTALIATIWIKERLSWLQWFGIAFSFAGVLTLITKGSWAVLLHFSFNLGDLLFFFCQFVWAIYSIIGLKVMQHLSAIATTAWSGLIGAGEVTIYALLTGQLTYTPLDHSSILCLLFVILCGGVGSMLFWNIGLKHAGPSIASVFSNLTPIFGMLCGYWFLQESIGILQLLGALTIFLGVYITTHSQQLVRLVIKRH